MVQSIGGTVAHIISLSFTIHDYQSYSVLEVSTAHRKQIPASGEVNRGESYEMRQTMLQSAFTSNARLEMIDSNRASVSGH